MCSNPKTSPCCSFTQQTFWLKTSAKTLFILTAEQRVFESHNASDEVYLLAGVQLLGQLLYVVFFIGGSQSGRAHAVVGVGVGGHHL